MRQESGELSQQPGAEGELLIRGLAVGYGYLKEEEKTKAVFIQNPRHNTYHDPLYCSGDLVRLADDGNILFLGRIDDQIKLRGNRIELGEIEAVMAGLSSIGEAVVVFHESPNPDEAEIGALVVSEMANGNEEEFLRRLRHELQDVLPVYMIPTRMAVTDEDLPLTPSGKYDRKNVRARLFD